MEYRICVGCGKRKEIGNFKKDYRSYDGYKRFCNFCRRNGWPEITDDFPKFEGKRKCKVCNEFKGPDDFSWSDRRMRTISTYCNKCKKEERRKYYDAEYHRKYKKNYDKKEADKKYYLENKEKVKARATVHYAIKKGQIPPVKTRRCACGKQAVHYHHHHGYDKKHVLDVIPVCMSCHRDLHKIDNKPLPEGDSFSRGIAKRRMEELLAAEEEPPKPESMIGFLKRR